MKTIFTLALCALATITIAAAQTEEPRYVLSIGAGFNEYTTPRVTQTGTVGVRIGEGLYSTTSLDLATQVDGGRRITVSTIRTGAQRIIARQGPVTLTASGDVGLAAGQAVTGSFSGGGMLAYTLPKRLGPLFAFGSVRIIKSPQNQADNPATVQSAFTFGIGFVLK